MEEEEVVGFVSPLFCSSRYAHQIRSLGVSVTASTRGGAAARGAAAGEPPLFADDVWPGARALSDYLDAHAGELCTGRSVLELGAGAALPSLCACKLGARICVATDYPGTDVVENISRQFAANGIETSQAVARAFVWGEDTAPLLEISKGDGFDTVLMSELLWKDTKALHAALLGSLKTLLAPRGIALISVVHRPTATHRVDDDLEFFRLASREFGLAVTPLGQSRTLYGDALSGGAEESDGQQQQQVWLFAINNNGERAINEIGYLARS